jgi:hypothetical protein
MPPTISHKLDACPSGFWRAGGVSPLLSAVVIKQGAHAPRSPINAKILWSTILLLLALVAPLAAATPRDELLRYVPEDVGFCWVLNDLRGHTARFLASPFVERWRRSPQAASLARSPEVAQLLKVESELRKKLGLSSTELRDDVLGDAVVFAYRPGPPGKPDQEQGIILLHAHKAETLAALVRRLTPDRKEIKTEERTYRGIRYHCRTEAGKPSYYYLQGPILVFSGQETMLQQALVRGQADTKAEPLIARRLRELGLERALLALWLNPRAFDADIEAKIERASPADAPGLKAFAIYWKALEGIGLSVNLDRDLSLALTLRGQKDRLPEAARRFLEAASRASDLWHFFPSEPLLALGSRVDLSSLSRAVGEFLPADKRTRVVAELKRSVGAVLGKDILSEVLPAIGPDWGLCVLAPSAQEASWFPQALLAVRVGPGTTNPPVNQVLLAALSRAIPPALRPVLKLQNGYLVLASSPEMIRRLNNLTPPPALPAPGDSIPLLRVSFKAWQQFLSERREAVTRVMVKKNHSTPEEAGKRLERMLATLQLLDRLEVRQRSTPEQVTFTVTLQTVQPLRK